jgi:hypothetical protein
VDNNSAFAKNAVAFRSAISEYTRNDSTIVVISANNSLDRLIAGTDPKNLAGVPTLTNHKAKADNVDEVFAWIIEAQCTREVEGKKSQALGVLIDFDISKHKTLFTGLKAKKDLQVIEALTPKPIQNTIPASVVKQPISSTKPNPKQKTWRDFKGAFVAVAILSILVGIILGILGFHYINEKYPNTLFKERIQEISLPTNEIVLELGRTVQLSPQIIPANAVDTELSYVSSNEKVVAVSETGLLTATKEGARGEDRIVTITISSSNGITVDVKATVKDSYYVYYADERIEYGSWITTPLLFKNAVPRCTGFTLEITITEITDGEIGNIEGQEFIVFGRATNDDVWVELGKFDCGKIGISTNADISFDEINLGQVICVMGERSSVGDGKLSWKRMIDVTNVQYAN